MEEGGIFLFKNDPFFPVVKWVEKDENSLKGKWVPKDFLDVPAVFYVENAVSRAESMPC